ncbi:cytochrome P450 [Flagelloscypha sp. PMI_526]|nr:cytochrome P450 [Flagelloscypha sp. PMI_526]
MSLFRTALVLIAPYPILSVLRRWWLASSSSLPCAGPGGPWGYIWTLIRTILDCNSVVEEGCRKFAGSPFLLPTLGGDVVILGPSAVEVLRKSDDSIFNGPERAKQLFQINLQFGDITSNPYHLETILRSDLTKALKRLTPDLLDEVKTAVPRIIPTDSNDLASVPVFNTMLSLVGQVVNRAMIGLPGCRDTNFLAQQTKLATTVISLAQVLNWFPDFLKSTVFSTSTLFVGGVKAVTPHLQPYVQERVQYAQKDDPQTITDLLLRFAPEEELLQPERLTVRVAHLNMASIHTSAIFTTQALFELALLSPEDLLAVRTEIRQAIDDEGGICNKDAVAKFHKLDSILKEIGRWHPLFAIGMSRVTLADATVPNSQGDLVHIPKGSVVSIAPWATHHDPTLYDEPERFRPFRFSERSDGIVGRQAFTALSNDYLLFGAGKHACPGRFLASLMVKLILAEIIMNYGLSYPDGKKERPAGVPFNLFTTPNPWAKLIFSKRK